MEEMQKRRPNAGPHFQEMMKKFDKDATANSTMKRKAMREAHRKARARPPTPESATTRRKVKISE